MGVGQCPATGAPREDGDTCSFRKFPEGVPGVGVPDAAARDDHRGVRFPKHLQHLSRALEVRRSGVHKAAKPSDFFRMDGRVEDVTGKLEVDRSGPSDSRGPECKIDEFGDPLRQGTDPGIFHHRRDDGKLVHILEIQFFDAFQSDAAGNQDHRGV